MRVVALVNTVAPYTSGIFSTLSKYSDLDLVVLYCSKSHRNRPGHWQETRISFRSEILSGLHIYWNGVSRDPVHVNLSLIGTLKRMKPQAVLIGGYSDMTSMLAFLFCKMNHIPVTLMIDGGDVNMHPMFVRSYVQQVIRMASAYVSAGSNAETVFEHYGAPKERIYRMPCVSDLKHIHEVASRIRLERKSAAIDTSRTILFVGRLVEEKGIQDLASAFIKLRDKGVSARLVIVGKGPMRNEIEKVLTRKYAADVVFHDFLEDEELVKAYVDSDVFVLPSRKEPFGIVAMEAFVSGPHVVLTSNCGCTELLPQSERVTQVPPYDVDSLVKALTQAISVSKAESNEPDIKQIQEILKKYSIESLAEVLRNAILSTA